MSTLLEQASLIMIPSGYAEDIVYSVIPETGAGDLSFTRASNGTRVNSAGLVEVVPWNLFEQSNAFSTSPWTLSNGTLTSGQSGYDGLANAWKYTEGTFIASLPNLSQPFTSTSAVESYNFYLKAGTRNWVIVSVVGTGYIWINLTDGTVGSSGGQPTVATVQSVGNGWYLVSVSSVGTKSGISLHITDANNSVSYNGNGTGFVYVQNSQRNIGSTAKPYFPTTDRLNVPRLTYQNGGGGCPSLLLEKQSTNELSYSEDFTNSAWTKVNATVTANDTISPDGTQNADKIANNSTTVEIYAGSSSPMTTSTTSVFVKKGNNKYFGITINGTNNFDSRFQGVFDLDNGTLYGVNNSATALTATSAKIESFANGWYRCSVTATFATSANGFVVFQHSNNVPTIPSNSLTWNNQSTGNSFIWGAQLEASSYPTSYIPTTSSSATRVADLINTTGKSALIGQTEGVIFADVVTISGDSDYVTILQLFGDYSNRLAIGLQVGTTNLFGYLNASGGGQFFNVSTQSAGRYKIAFAYKSGEMALYINGVSAFTSTSTFTFAVTLDTIFMNNLNATAEIGSFKVNESIIFPTRLTNSELAQLTGNQNYTINQAYASYGVASESPNCVQP